MLTGDILRLSARRHPTKTASICEDRRMSYGELDGASNRFANAVLALGLVKGEAVNRAIHVAEAPGVPRYVVHDSCIESLEDMKTLT